MDMMKKVELISKGFTLIELLVVIAIIGLLLAIIVPALQIAKEQATGAVCLSNQKGLILSYKLYIEDNDGRLPDANVRPNHPYSWVNPPTLPDGTQVYNVGSNVTLEDRFRGIQNGVMFPYGENVKLYHCPGDRRIKIGTNYGIEPDYKMYRSYNIQGGLNGEEVDISPNGVCPTQISQIRKSLANVYVFVEEYYDGAGSNCNGGSWQLGSGPDDAGWWNTMSVWHNWRSTLSFIDGHAEMIRWRDKRTLLYAEDRNNPEIIGEKRSQAGNPDLRYMVQGYGVPLPR